MSIESDLLLGYAAALENSSATLSYLSGSTPLTCSVIKSYGHNIKYDYNQFGTEKKYDDLSVMALKSDVGTWGLEPRVSTVYVDGIKYMVGGVVTYTSVYDWISLRTANSLV